MKNKLTWLHISDIHFHPSKAWRDSGTQDGLIDYLKAMFEGDNMLRPDLIFCTGDIAYGEIGSSPLAEQYEQAKAFFDKLLVVCGRDGKPLSKQRLFVVAGNHDVNRNGYNKFAQEMLTHWAKDANQHIETINQLFNDRSTEFKDAVKRLDEYAQFIQDYLPHQADGDGRHRYTHIVDIDGLKIGIAGFNSAWSCAGPKDDRTVWLAAEWQFTAAHKIIKTADVRIGLIHHPVDWFNVADRDIATRRISTDFHFWLHGHVHNQWLEPMQSHIVIAAGAVGAENSDEFGINLICIDLATSEGVAYLHKHRRGGRSWEIAPIEIHAPRGQWPFNLPDKLKPVATTPPPSTSLPINFPEDVVAREETSPERSVPYPKEIRWYIEKYLKDKLCEPSAKELEKYIDLSATTVKADVPPQSKSYDEDLVPPEFFEDGGLQYGVSNESHGDNYETETILNSISEALELHQYFVLLGEPGSGKSTTLKKLWVDQARKALTDLQAQIPVLINLAEWPPNIDSFPDLLVKKFELLINPVDHNLIMPVLILLDGLNEIEAKVYSARVKALDEWLKTQPKASVIISCREKHYLNGKKIAIPSVHILPFDTKRIQSFLEAFLGLDAAKKLLLQLESTNQSERSARDLIHLAHNPYLLRRICFIYKENNQQIPDSRGDLFRSLVTILYRREKNRKQIYGITYEQMLNAFTGIAFAMQWKRLSTSVHTDWAAKQITNVDSESLWKLGRDASLLEFTKDGRVLQFTHQLILEYFAAEGLSKRLNELRRYIDPPDFAGNGRKSGVWDEVLFTLAGLLDSDDFWLKLAEIDPFVTIDCFAYTKKDFIPSDKLIQCLVVRLVSYFPSHSLDAKLVAIAKLEQLGEDVVLEHLLEALQKTDNIITKKEGLKILSRYKNSRALAHIILALNDNNKWVRRDSENLLAENFKQFDVEAAYSDFIYPLFCQSNLDIFANITAKLYRINCLSQDCISLICYKTISLLPLLLKSHDFAFDQIADLKNLSVHYFSNDVDRLRFILSVIKAIEHNNDFPEDLKLKCLFTQLTDDNAAIRIASITALSFLKHSCVNVRVKHIESLSRHSDVSPNDEILPFLDDESNKVRLAAITALINCGHNLTTHQIVTWLKDKSPSIRLVALKHLINCSQAVPQDEVFILLNDQSASVRRAAIKTIARYSEKFPANQIYPLLNDQNVEVRLAALNALIAHGANFTAEQALLLFNDKSSMIRVNALKYLADKNVLSVDEITPFLSDCNVWVRRLAIDLLSHHNDV